MQDTSGTPVNEILPVRSDDLQHLRFLNRAAATTDRCLDDTVAAIRAGELGRGMWHPTGFATFEVAQVAELGLVRVHFWPVGLRRQLSGHPPIHQHCFRLFSRVLAGEYRESQYRPLSRTGAAERQGTHADGRLLRTYEVRDTGVMGKDEVHDTGEDLYVIPTVRSLRFPAGSWHEVAVNTFHATPIPRSRFCATLAVLSLPVAGARDVLLGQPGFGPASHTRRVVSDEEWRRMRGQFLDLWET
ncbi:hypothetical protein [Streptomyces sp. NL15-2K]|uniref:hypothetical protein n=1 Tax=Streptomyces sp. NL15-2K TaxID=376149 RepID=UPI000F58CC53|nr:MULTISPECIES: hypothetical protein [Actinomycetes]WKX09454.1 hypothetical protein Q4V64_18960 [Kutzneria buriramensis]